MTSFPLQVASSAGFSLLSALFNRRAQLPSDDTVDFSNVRNTEAFLSARGTYVKVTLREGNPLGAYAIKELNYITFDTLAERYATQAARSSTSDWLKTVSNKQTVSRDADLAQFADSLQYPILLLQVQIAQSDLVSAVACLDNFKVLYTFGQNFGQVQIGGEVLLGSIGTAGEARAAQRLRDFFAKYRISVWKQPIKLSTLGTSYLVYLTGMQLGAVDTNFNVLPFVLTGMLIDPQNEKAAGANTVTQVLNDETIPRLMLALTLDMSEAAAVTPTTAPSMINLSPPTDRPQETLLESDAIKFKNTTQGESPYRDLTTPLSAAQERAIGKETQFGYEINKQINDVAAPKPLETPAAETTPLPEVKVASQTATAYELGGLTPSLFIADTTERVFDYFQGIEHPPLTAESVPPTATDDWAFIKDHVQLPTFRGGTEGHELPSSFSMPSLTFGFPGIPAGPPEVNTNQGASAPAQPRPAPHEFLNP